MTYFEYVEIQTKEDGYEKTIGISKIGTTIQLTSLHDATKELNMQSTTIHELEQRITDLEHILAQGIVELFKLPRETLEGCEQDD